MYESSPPAPSGLHLMDSPPSKLPTPPLPAMPNTVAATSSNILGDLADLDFGSPALASFTRWSPMHSHGLDVLSWCIACNP